MSIIKLEVNDLGYSWNGQMVNFATGHQDPYKDKLFMIDEKCAVYEVIKVLESKKVDRFLSEKGANVLSLVEVNAETLSYATVFQDFPRKCSFVQGSSPAFPGYTREKTWNGFATPYFPLETMNEICKYFSVVYGTEEGSDLAECRCFYLEKDDAYYVEDYYDDYLRERIATPVILNTPSGPLKLYYFEGCWDWVEVEE